MAESNTHIVNINRALKNIKLKVKTDFVWTEQAGIIITTNKIATQLDLQTIEQYIKNMNYIKADSVKTPCLPQSKSYLKIIGIPYLLENTNTPIIANVVETIIKNSHIFNNITIISKPKVIKVSSKLDMAII